jgi:hypothetical protein
MDDAMLIKYLREHGMGPKVDEVLSEMAFKQFSKKTGKEDMEVVMAEEEIAGDHFTEQEAKELVASMYHCHAGRKYIGEKFSLSKAKEVHEKYKGMLPSSVTLADIYVAINAQYHDYITLFKSWLGSDIEDKIIESALIFWFCDSDYKDNSKVYRYFHN